MDKLLIKQCLFHGSWLVVPFMAWLGWRLRERRGRWLVALLLAGCLVFAWARFVEPQRIRVQETVLTGTGAQARLVLISDIHLGVYNDRAYLQRLVDRINTLRADAIVIAGDFTYEPDGEPLERMFAPLETCRSRSTRCWATTTSRLPAPTSMRSCVRRWRRTACRSSKAGR